MPRRPTILQIIPRLDTGGAELATVEITAALVSAGARALVASEGGRMAHQVTAAGGELVDFPAATKNPAQLIANAIGLARLIEREDIDLLHARSRAPAWSAFLAARRTHRPFVTTYHGAYAERGPAKRLYNSIMARGDVVIANSHYTADLIRARYGTDPDRIAVIPRGVDLDRFAPDRIAPERIAELLRRWAVTETQPIILQAARLTRWKGQEVLIAAIAELRQQDRLGEAVAVLAGDAQGRDDYAGALARQAAALGVADRVRLVGHVEDIAAAYAVAQVTVVASTEPEAFGRAAAEALAMGCPVIGTRLGALPESVLAEPGAAPGEITGWLVPPGDSKALALCLRTALSLSPAERTAMAARARADALRRFAVSAMQRQTLAVYDRLLGTRLAEQAPPSQAA
ncbi:MAG TPA: glycosyltransferase family 4 protein [Hyphomicrobiaceae bacterium]|nr:glycosyltransferase family 4 protein [Hyphomicrobiaceae bacterium]